MLAVWAHSEGALSLEVEVSMVVGYWEGEVRVAVWAVVLVLVALVARIWYYVRAWAQRVLRVH